MEQKNTWETYNEKQLEALEELAAEYRDFLDEGKTERECVDAIVNAAEQKGYRDIQSVIREGKSLKSGDKVYAVCMNKSVVMFRIGKRPMAEGMNIAMVYPEDGSSCVPDGSALVKGAPHEDNAKLFLDFTVSSEVQQLLAGRLCRRSVRDDVASADELTPLDGLPLAEYDLDRAVAEREAILMTWAFYAGEEKP